MLHSADFCSFQNKWSLKLFFHFKKSFSESNTSERIPGFPKYAFEKCPYKVPQNKNLSMPLVFDNVESSEI